ncbi:hypothetical protein NSP_41110 [Nodularia spumigena CCY9414]|nr:hypothetical protein NSP_41110 [Nodularia spumigena CCY9414]
MAGIPPQVAQSPTATINLAAWDKSVNQSFIGRSANRFHSPVPLGAFTTLPSKTKISRGILPEMQSRRRVCRSSPISNPKEGCQSTLMPKSAIRSHTVGSSALRNDMVFPEHAPPCSHSTLVISYTLIYC